MALLVRMSVGTIALETIWILCSQFWDPAALSAATADTSPRRRSGPQAAQAGARLGAPASRRYLLTPRRTAGELGRLRTEHRTPHGGEEGRPLRVPAASRDAVSRSRAERVTLHHSHMM